MERSAEELKKWFDEIADQLSAKAPTEKVLIAQLLARMCSLSAQMAQRIASIEKEVAKLNDAIGPGSLAE